MKNSLIWATSVAILATVHFAAADVAAQRPSTPGVAIVDLTYIFANHTRFKAMTEDMRRDVEEAERNLKAQKESLQKMAEQLDQYRRGTPDYKSLEEELAKRQADMSAQVNLQKKNFLEQEAKNYYTVYLEILDQIKYYADANGISLVLRFNGDPIDSQDPREVIKELNKSVVYYNRTIDITPVILDAVNQTSPRPAGRPPIGATGPATKPHGVPTRR